MVNVNGGGRARQLAAALGWLEASRVNARAATMLTMLTAYATWHTFGMVRFAVGLGLGFGLAVGLGFVAVGFGFGAGVGRGLATVGAGGFRSRPCENKTACMLLSAHSPGHRLQNTWVAAANGFLSWSHLRPSFEGSQSIRKTMPIQICDAATLPAGLIIMSQCGAAVCRKTADAFTPFIDITAVEMTSRSLQLCDLG